MATEISNITKYLLATHVIDFSSDAFNIMLVADGFVFDKDTHEVYGDVSGSELPTGNGYTAGGAVLGGIAITRNDVDDRTEITWNNATWTANGGPIGPSPGAIIYDDTVGAPVKPIIQYIDFGGNQTQADGGMTTVANPETRIS